MTGARAQDDDPGRVVREQKATTQRRAAVPAICLMLAGALAACGTAGGPGDGGSARRSAAGFLAAYVQPDGRVSRLDQGGDTVSEGSSRLDGTSPMCGSCLSAEGAVEVERGADQREVGQCLGEVSLLVPGAADLLGVQAQVVGVGEHLLEG